MATLRTRPQAPKRPSVEAAEPLGHLLRHPRGGRLMRIGFNARGRTCAHTVSHSAAAVCHPARWARAYSTCEASARPAARRTRAHVHREGSGIRAASSGVRGARRGARRRPPHRRCGCVGAGGVGATWRRMRAASRRRRRRAGAWRRRRGLRLR